MNRWLTALGGYERLSSPRHWCVRHILLLGTLQLSKIIGKNICINPRGRTSEKERKIVQHSGKTRPKVINYEHDPEKCNRGRIQQLFFAVYGYSKNGAM
jgi:hypothetical protein